MTVNNMIKGHDLFRSLTIDENHMIADFSSVKLFHPNEFVFRYGTAGSHIYMLMKGGVNLRLPSDPAEFSFVISKIEKGELFGISPLLDQPRYTASAQCTKETEVLSIEAQPFREMLMNNQTVGYDIINQVAHIYFNRYIQVIKSVQGVLGQISLIR